MFKQATMKLSMTWGSMTCRKKSFLTLYFYNFNDNRLIEPFL